MLTEEQIEEFNKSIEETTAKQDELKSKHEETRNKIASLSEKINSNLAENEKMNAEIREQKVLQQEIANEYNPLNHTITAAEEALAKDAWEKSLAELVSQQPDFYTVCERELTKIQAELKETVGDFVEFVDPATAIENMRTAIEGGGIGYSLVSLREGKNHYINAIKDLCEKKLKGNSIDLSTGALPVDRIKHWLRTNEVITYWKK